VILTAAAYHNWGRWVVECPQPRCFNAEQVATAQPSVECRDCGQRCDIMWPSNPAHIEKVLAARLDAQRRNWYPSESVDDLIAENVAHPGEVR